MHRGRLDRLDADDAHLGTKVLHVGADAGGETAAADRHEHDVERIGVLAAELDRDRALTCDRVGIVEGVDEREAARLAERQGMGERGVEVVSRAAPPRRRVRAPRRS